MDDSIMNDSILEPLKMYNDTLSDEFDKNADELFDSLVKQSQMNVDENRTAVEEYRKEVALVNSIDSEIKKLQGWRTFLIVVSIVLALATAGSIFAYVEEAVADLLVVICLGAATLAVVVLTIVLCITAFNPKIKSAKAEKDEHEKLSEEMLAKAYGLIQPLIDLFDEDQTRQLVVKTAPMLQFDRNFDMRRFDFLNSRFDYTENHNINQSTVGVLSGEILGNPFVFERRFRCDVAPKTYTGSLTIHWTESYTDSKGNRQTRMRSETLYASVVKPKPYYRYETFLCYGNDAAPDLYFSHEPHHVERMNDGKMKKYVNKGSKQLQKRSRKEAQNGGNFTTMTNETFDVLFNGDERDNEVQFRLLFTPLAQQNMIALLTDKLHYGDDFYFVKNKRLNTIRSEHAQDWDMDVNVSKYRTYDVDECRKLFKTYNKQYFKSVFFDFAPLLAIPLYQQNKPQEYIYKEDYARNYTSYETEVSANAFRPSVFAHPDTSTDVILKAGNVVKKGETDKTCITAHSYKAVDRVDYVTKLGGDGSFHEIAVPWVEYIPLERDTEISVKQIDVTESQYRNETGGKIAKAVDTLGNHSYHHGLLACLTETDEFDDIINNIIK